MQATEYTEAHEPHDEQVQVWGSQVAEALEPWIKEFDSYDDKLAFFKVLEDEIREIGIAAHEAGMIRAKST